MSVLSYSIQLNICMLIFKKVRQRYELWNEDQTTFEIVIDNDTSPAIELDQQEEKLDQWKIVPLSSPSQVY